MRRVWMPAQRRKTKREYRQVVVSPVLVSGLVRVFLETPWGKLPPIVVGTHSKERFTISPVAPVLSLILSPLWRLVSTWHSVCRSDWAWPLVDTAQLENRQNQLPRPARSRRSHSSKKYKYKVTKSLSSLSRAFKSQYCSSQSPWSLKRFSTAEFLSARFANHWIPNYKVSHHKLHRKKRFTSFPSQPGCHYQTLPGRE